MSDHPGTPGRRSRRPRPDGRRRCATPSGSTRASGLDDAEAARRAADAGPNALEHSEAPSVWRMVIDAATEPFVLLLMASGLGAILLNEVRDGILILLGLVPIVGADVLTEYRGERALEALREHRRQPPESGAAARSQMSRRRRSCPGDVVLIRVGDVVPADLRASSIDRLSIDRSILTGESLPEPVARRARCAGRRPRRPGGRWPSPAPASSPGEARASWWRSAPRPRSAGSPAACRRATRRRSPLQRELDRLVRILIVVAVGLIGITTGLGFVRGNPIGREPARGHLRRDRGDPEEPPILLAVVLGLGAFRLLKRGVLVRRLNAEEVLGAVDLVVTDKTGTLTQNRLEIASLDRRWTARSPTRRPPGSADRRAARGGRRVAARDRRRRRARSRRRWPARVEAEGGNPHPDPADLVSTEPVTDSRPYSSTIARRGGVDRDARDRGARGGGGARRCVAARARRVARRARGGRRARRARRRRRRTHRRVGAWTLRGLVGFADALRPGIAEATAGPRSGQGSRSSWSPATTRPPRRRSPHRPGSTTAA